MAKNPSGMKLQGGAIDSEIATEFLIETYELIEDAEKIILDLERTRLEVSKIHKLFRSIHTIKGNSAYFGLKKIQSLTQSVENYLTTFRDSVTPLENISFDLLLEGIDALKYLLTDLKPAAEIANRAQSDSTYNASQLKKLISRLGVTAN